MNIVLVGTGNVAVILSRLLVTAGHSIVEVHGRNENMRHQISKLTGAKNKANFSDMTKSADLCLLAVSDNVIPELANQVNAGDTLVVHTSGATSKEVLYGCTNYGVLYPLQSLRKEMMQLPPIPFLIDANKEANTDKLFELASSTGNHVTVAGDEERLRYHIAAVLCSNFTNHLYAVTESFCKNENIDFAGLLPLIQETALRLTSLHAVQMQTGPAIRRDFNTIQRHLELLRNDPAVSSMYQLLTESIQRFSKLEN